jgi:ABC-type sugar transport system substrate-binding protein
MRPSPWRRRRASNEGHGVTTADKLGEITGGKANVLFLLNSPDIPNQATQRQSFIDRSKAKWPNIKVVDTQLTNNDPVNAAKILEAMPQGFKAFGQGVWDHAMRKKGDGPSAAAPHPPLVRSAHCSLR